MIRETLGRVNTSGNTQHGPMMPVTIDAWIRYIREPGITDFEADDRAFRAVEFAKPRGPVALSQLLAGVAELQMERAA